MSRYEEFDHDKYPGPVEFIINAVWVAGISVVLYLTGSQWVAAVYRALVG